MGNSSFILFFHHGEQRTFFPVHVLHCFKTLILIYHGYFQSDHIQRHLRFCGERDFLQGRQDPDRTGKNGIHERCKNPETVATTHPVKPDLEIAPQFYHDSKDGLLHPVRQNMYQLFHPGQHQQSERRRLESSNPRFADPLAIRRQPAASPDGGGCKCGKTISHIPVEKTTADAFHGKERSVDGSGIRTNRAKKSSCRTRHPERKRRKDMDTTHGLGHEPTNRVRLCHQREWTGCVRYTRAY